MAPDYRGEKVAPSRQTRPCPSPGAPLLWRHCWRQATPRCTRRRPAVRRSPCVCCSSRRRTRGYATRLGRRRAMSPPQRASVTWPRRSPSTRRSRRAWIRRSRARCRSGRTWRVHSGSPRGVRPAEGGQEREGSSGHLHTVEVRGAAGLRPPRARRRVRPMRATAAASPHRAPVPARARWAASPTGPARRSRRHRFPPRHWPACRARSHRAGAVAGASGATQPLPPTEPHGETIPPWPRATHACASTTFPCA